MATHIGYGKFYNPDGINVMNAPVYEASLPTSPGFYGFTGAESIGGVTASRIFPLITFDQSGDVSPSNTISSGSDPSDFIGFQANSDESGYLFVVASTGSSTTVFPTQYGSDNYDAIIIVHNTRNGLYVPLQFSTLANKILLTGVEPGVSSLEIVDIPDPVIPSPDSFIVKPDRAYVESGDEIQFKVLIDGVEASEGIVWSLVPDTMSEGSSQLEGITISENGLINVGEFTASRILVKALSTLYSVSAFSYLYNKNDPYGPDGPSGPGLFPGSGVPGGGPSGPGTGTLIPNGSNNPNLASGGTFTMYAANQGTLQGLGNWLYSSNFFDAVGRDIMSALWNSPIEGVISIMAFPFGIPASANQPSSIKFGSLEVPISLPILQNSSMQIDWGSVTISPTWNSFIDYAPHTKIELYLPFGTGFVNLDPHEVTGGSVSIVTNVDLIKGSCVHIVSGKYGVIGTYCGTCGIQIPVSGIDTAGKALDLLVSGVTTAVTAGAGAIGHDLKALGEITNAPAPSISPSLPPMDGPPQLALPGNVPTSNAGNKLIKGGQQFSAVASRSAKVAGKTALAAFRTPASVQRSGSFTSGAGGLGPTNPFIIYSCPSLNVPANYGHFYGYPLNATMRIGDLKGYSEITGVHLNNVPALVPELDELDNLLMGGVIL